VVDLVVVVPSRGRPGNVERLVQAWHDTSQASTELVVAVDEDDPRLKDYQEIRMPFLGRLRVGRRLRLGGTLNEVAAEYADRAFAIGFMGDDHVPRTVGWDATVTAALEELGTGIVYGDDLIQGAALPTAAFMTSDIISALGYMVPGGLVHLEIDTAWLLLGRAIDRIRYLPEVVIEHCHPIAHTAEWDDGYAEANDPAQYEADGRRLEEWMRDGLDGDVAKLKGLIASKEGSRG
jgi:hypothetical protein